MQQKFVSEFLVVKFPIDFKYGVIQKDRNPNKRKIAETLYRKIKAVFEP